MIVSPYGSFVAYLRIWSTHLKSYNSQEVKKFKNPYKMSFCSATHSFYTVIFKQLLPKSKHVRGEKKSDESVHFHEAASFFVVGFFLCMR